MEINLANISIPTGKPKKEDNFPLSPDRIGNSDFLDNAGDPRFKKPDDLLQQVVPNKTQLLTQQLNDLQERYDRDLNQWKDYERQVHEWKNKVMDMVSSQVRDPQNNNRLTTEIKELKAELRTKDKEIARLQLVLEQASKKKSSLFGKLI